MRSPHHVEPQGRFTKNLPQEAIAVLSQPSVQSLPIDYLHVKLRNRVTGKYANTIGDALRIVDEQLQFMPQFGDASLRELEASLKSLVDSVDFATGTIDWRKYWASRGIPVIPDEYAPELTEQQIVAYLPQILEEILDHDPRVNERSNMKWRIIKSRFEIDGERPLTLQKLAKELGRTHERVRQIESQALKTLDRVLFHNDHSGKNFRVRKEVIDAVQQFAREVAYEVGVDQKSIDIEQLLVWISKKALIERDLADSAGEYKERQIKARLGQEEFRIKVLRNFDHTCCLSGVTEPELLEACHVVAWREELRYAKDVRNGLCMLGTLHDLFDIGYISFDDDLTVLITHRCPELSKPLQEILNSLKGRKARRPNEPIGKDYLKRHRKRWQYE